MDSSNVDTRTCSGNQAQASSGKRLGSVILNESSGTESESFREDERKRMRHSGGRKIDPCWKECFGSSPQELPEGVRHLEIVQLSFSIGHHNASDSICIYCRQCIHHLKKSRFVKKHMSKCTGKKCLAHSIMSRYGKEK